MVKSIIFKETSLHSLTPSFRGLATLATLGREAAERERSAPEVTTLV